MQDIYGWHMSQEMVFHIITEMWGIDAVYTSIILINAQRYRKRQKFQKQNGGRGYSTVLVEFQWSGHFWDGH